MRGEMGRKGSDGIPDIIAGPWLYLGPDYKVRKEIYLPTSYNPTSEYPLPLDGKPSLRLYRWTTY
jgi:hypothetical protein